MTGESAREAAKAGLGKLIAWLGAGLVAAIAGWWNWNVVAGWFRHLAGR